MNILMLTSPAPARSGFSTSEKRPPLGVGVLIAILESRGHTVVFDDQYLKPWPIFDNNAFLKKHNIDIVGIYSNTICLQGTLSLVRKLNYLREQRLWGGRIAVGGPHTSYGAEALPPYIDHICIGEGDISFHEMIEGVETRRIVHGKKVEDLDTLPMPAWHHFIYRGYDWSSQWNEGYPMYTMNTSRGCPFSCTFCSVKGVWGQTYRFMSAERIIEDLKIMQRYYGMKATYFREDHFTLNPRRTTEFCEGLIRQKMVFPWLCETRADSVDSPGVLELMAKAGCKALYIGIESGSQRMLDLLEKHERVEQFEFVIKEARRVGMRTYASMIYGVPGETPQDIAETEAFLERTKPDYVGKNLFAGLPGSELYAELRDTCAYDYEDENGLLYPKDYENRTKKFYGNSKYFAVVSNALGTASPAQPNLVVRREKTPLVSVILPIHNGTPFGAEAIQSILAQSLEDFELLILDDASTDDTEQMLEAQRDPRIYLHKNQENLGITQSLNILLGLARGRYIARMDADDLSYPHRLAVQVDFMQKNPAVWVCGGFHSIVRGEQEWNRGVPLTHDEITAAMLFGNKLAHPFVMLNGDAFREHKLLYDKKMKYAQDYELWARIACQYPQARLANVPALLGKYREHPAAISKAKLEEQKGFAFRALLQILKKLNLPTNNKNILLQRHLRFREMPESESKKREIVEWAMLLKRSNDEVNLFCKEIFEKNIKEALMHVLRP